MIDWLIDILMISILNKTFFVWEGICFHSTFILAYVMKYSHMYVIYGFG